MPTSTLTLPNDFGENNRSVRLDGEAYFEIEAREKPFLIHANKATFASASGASMNIKAYAADSLKRVWVTEGDVVFYSRTGPLKFELYWQRLINSNNDTVPRRGVAITRHGFVYKNADVAEVMQDMSRWYNININYSAGSKVFTGFISDEGSVGKMMEVVRKECGVTFTAEDNVLSVR